MANESMLTAPPPEARHILSFAQSLRGGGVERALLRLAGGWIDAGRRVTLVVGDRRGPLANEIPQGVELIGGSVAAATRRLRPDLIFCPGNYYTSRAAWLRVQLAGRCPPIVAKMSNRLRREDLPPPLRWGNRAWLRLHPLFLDRFVAMTPSLADATVAATGASAARVSVIANPPVRARPGAPSPLLPAGRFLLGVGRLVPQKRWDRLIDALPHLADRTVQAVILGEGQERERLRARAEALGVGDRVWLPGHAADPLPALRQAALVVLPSDFEGAPGVLREALSVGTPVVATESSVAIREIVTGPSLGTIAPHDDAQALVAAIDHWLAPGMVRPMPVPEPGEHAAADYLALFDALVQARRSAAAIPAGAAEIAAAI